MIDVIVREAVREFTSPRWLGKWAAMRDAGRRPRMPEEWRSVLVARLDEIGDMVLTSPFLRELRKGIPNAQITLLVSPTVLNLVERCPHVDRVASLQIPPMTSLRIEVQRHWQLRHSMRQLFPKPPDAAIIPRMDVDRGGTTLAALYSGARFRAGYSEQSSPAKRAENKDYDRLLTHWLVPAGPMHEVERNLALLRHLGIEAKDAALELWLSPQDQEVARNLLGSFRQSETLVAVCPGAGHRRRQWPADQFSRTAQLMLSHDPNLRFVVIGGPGEESLGKATASVIGLRALNLAGKMTLRQTAALLGMCKLYIGNDTGPMHLAAAAKIPVVLISCSALDGDPTGPNAPQRFGPWGVPGAVLQSPHLLSPCIGCCRAQVPHCILQISSEDAAQASLKLLGKD